MLELRMAIGIEAVGLAAGRRAPADLLEVRTRLEAVVAAKDDAGTGADEDFAFRRAILAATGNPHFIKMFDVFGSRLIPQQRFRLEEHEAMRTTFEAGDIQAARKAAHDHLMRIWVHSRGLLES